MFPELKTERLILKQILPGDQDFIFKGLSHPKIIPYYGVRYDSFDATAAQMEFYTNLEKEATGTWWKITDAQTGERLGAIGYNNYISKFNKAEIGYWLLPEFWRKGYIREALTAVINYLQTELKIHRIESIIEVGNDDSIKVMEKFGFEYEGTMRDCEIKNGKYISLMMYALVKVPPSSG